MTTTINPQEIAAHIDAMDALCEKGRSQVKELVGKLFGVELVSKPENPKPKPGEVWRGKVWGTPCILDACLRPVSLWTGEVWHVADPSELCTYAAPNLATYIAEGGKL